MKKIISFTFLLFSSAIILAQKGETIVPSGNIITKDVIVKPFDAIDAKGLYELILTQGDKESVKIEADDNLPFLKTPIQNSIKKWAESIASIIEYGKESKEFKTNTKAMRRIIHL